MRSKKLWRWMKGMLKKYKPFFKAGAINALAYKAALLTWLIITVLEVGCVIFLWKAVFDNATPLPGQIEPIINGFTFKQIIVYFVFVNILTFVSFPGETIWTINDEIKKGTICMAFTKPISYRGRLLATTLGLAFAATLVFGLPMFIISYTIFACLGFIKIVSVWGVFFSIMMYLLLQISAIILRDGIDYFFGICCFYTTSGWGLNFLETVVVNFFGGTLLPISFFKFGDVDLSKAINYLPFAGMVQNPVMALLSDYSNSATYLHVLHTLGLSICWIIVIELIDKIFFNFASKKVTVQGG